MKSPAKPQNVPEDGTEIIQKLIQNDKDRYQTTRLFDKAQFHQCIPNPKKAGELITVQLFTPNLKETEPRDSLEDMKQKNLDPAGLYARCLTTNMSSLSSDILLDDPNTINEE